MIESVRLPTPSAAASTGAEATVPWAGAKPARLVVTVLIGVAIWLAPGPAAIDARAWHLFAIFVATIVGLILKPLPMGAVAMTAIATIAMTRVLTVAEAFSGFSNATIWLIVGAFFISRGFSKTRLDSRIAYNFLAVVGKRTLGVAYSLIGTDLVLAPAIPSYTARAGGVLFPLLRAIAKVYGSEPNDGTARRIGAFLAKATFQGTIITSAMFLTAMAANPLAARLALQMDVHITWTNWAAAAAVPGLVSLIVVPLVIYWLYPPEITTTPEAARMARDQLDAMGSVTRPEWIMLGVFALMLLLWILGERLLGIDSTTTVLIGLALLIVSGVLTWDDVLAERGAWDTLVWFAALVMMASFLNELGLIAWVTATMKQAVGGVSWKTAFLALSLVYFYSHYLFASNTAHVSAMYAAFLAVAIATGAPPLLAALVLGFFSNLFSSMTHYGAGPAPVYFGAGYVDLATWWKLGALVSVINIGIWLGIGGLWWKVLGLW